MDHGQSSLRVATESWRRSAFQATCERYLDGDNAVVRLWRVEENVVTFPKNDKGVDEQVDGVQSRKPRLNLDG